MEFIKVVTAKFLIGRAIFQHMVNDHQKRMRHCQRAPFLSAAGGQTSILSLKVGAFFPASGPGSLHQGGAQPFIAPSGFAALALARTFVAAGIDAYFS